MPQAFTVRAVEHGTNLRWSPPSNSGSAPITYNISWNGGAQTVTGTSASVSGLANGQSYAFTLTAADGAGTGPPAIATAKLAYPVRQFNAFDDESGSVNVDPNPAPSANGVGQIPQGSGQAVTVICQTAGVSFADPVQTWKTTDIWDKIEWNGGTAYVLDLYIDTPASAGYGSTAAGAPPGDVFSDPPLWHCS
jgi:hypothetical protein